MEQYQLKQCTKCGETKTLDCFGKAAKYKEGLNSRCKQCWNLYYRDYYKANTETVKANNKAWAKANPDKVKARNKAWRAKNPDHDKAWAKANPDKVKAIQEAWRAENPDYQKAWREANPDYQKAWREKRAKLNQDQKLDQDNP